MNGYWTRKQVDRLVADILEAHADDSRVDREVRDDGMDFGPPSYVGSHFVPIDSDDGSADWLAEYNATDFYVQTWFPHESTLTGE